jgi:hypothetical protein
MTKKEKLKKESNNSYFSYYHENLKFYFTGFCIALGLFIILFALWVISFNSTPQLLNNPKTLYYLKDNAFWEISTWEIEINQTNKIKNTIIAAYPILYHIGENQIPSLSKNYYIIREWESKNVSINPLIKYLRLPEIKTKAFDSWKVENILFKTATWKYYISIDFNHNKIEIFNANEEYVEQEKEFTDKEIIKYIKTELTNLGLTLKHYWDPILTENSASEVTVFYPRIIEDKEIWSSDKKQEWLNVTFDRNQWIITDVYNYDVQSYELSKYQLQKTKKQILETLSKEWNIDTTKKWQEWSIPMKKWKLIYLEKEWYLVPAILFKPEINIEKNIITPLY